MRVGVWMVPVVVLLGGCSGAPLITGDTDHEIHIGGAVQDSRPLSVQVQQALRGNAQTSLARIQVSTVSEDSVKLSGSVDNDAIRQEAERIAGQVSGVRFVVNTLSIRQ